MYASFFPIWRVQTASLASFRVLLCLLSVSFLVGQTARAQHDVEEALDYFRLGKLSQAQEMLEENLRLDAQDIYSRLYLGLMVEYLGETEKAISIWEAGLCGKSSDFDLYMQIGESYYRRGKFNELYPAEAFFDAQTPKDSTEQDFFSKSIKSYEKAASIAPYEPDPTLALLFIYKDRKLYDQALQYADKLNTFFPENADYWIEKANLYWESDQKEAAYKMAQKALELNPQQVEGHKLTAQYYRHIRQDSLADLSDKKYRFYEKVPDFVKLEWDTTYYNLLAPFLTNALSYRLSAEEKQAAFEKITPSKDPTSRYNELMTVLLANPYALTLEQFEQGAAIIAETDSVGENDLASGQHYLFQLLESQILSLPHTRKILEVLFLAKARGFGRFLINQIQHAELSEQEMKVYFQFAKSLRDDSLLPYFVQMVYQNREENQVKGSFRLSKHKKKRIVRQVTFQNRLAGNAVFAIAEMAHHDVEPLLKEFSTLQGVELYAQAALLVKSKDKFWLKKLEEGQRKNRTFSPQLAEYLLQNVSPHQDYYKRVSKLATRLR
jgi:tetratricopeptide (TPR) repeat protein